jgi:hypothetical protein
VYSSLVVQSVFARYFLAPGSPSLLLASLSLLDLPLKPNSSHISKSFKIYKVTLKFIK